MKPASKKVRTSNMRKPRLLKTRRSRCLALLSMVLVWLNRLTPARRQALRRLAQGENETLTIAILEMFHRLGLALLSGEERTAPVGK